MAGADRSGAEAASGVANEIEVAGNVTQRGDCLAGMNGDAMCKHRVGFYLLIGALDLAPVPDPLALERTIDCPECRGCGIIHDRDKERAITCSASVVSRY